MYIGLLSLCILMLITNSTEGLDLTFFFASFHKSVSLKDSIVTVVMLHGDTFFFPQPLLEAHFGDRSLTSTKGHLIYDMDVFGCRITKNHPPMVHIVICLTAMTLKQSAWCLHHKLIHGHKIARFILITG